MVTNELEQLPDRVILALHRDGFLVNRVYAKLRGDSQLDVIQAISYATHLIYKFAEQDELGGKI